MKRGASIFLALLLSLSLTIPVYAAVGDDDGNEGLISGIVGGIVDGLISGITFLFVPDNEFLEDFQSDITSTFERKFSGIIDALDYLKDRFSDMRGYQNFDDFFRVTWPEGSILHGMSVNFLGAPSDIIKLLRQMITGFFVVGTAIISYRKVVAVVRQ